MLSDVNMLAQPSCCGFSASASDPVLLSRIEQSWVEYRLLEKTTQLQEEEKVPGSRNLIYLQEGGGESANSEYLNE